MLQLDVTRPHVLVEESISRSLDDVFRDNSRKIPAALVVFDPALGQFRFGGFNKAFEAVFEPGQLKQLAAGGMSVEPGGLLAYAVKRFKLSRQEIWGYSINLSDGALLESRLQPKGAGVDGWSAITEAEICVGGQLRDFVDSVRRLDLPSVARLVLVPFTTTASFDGLVLLASLEGEQDGVHRRESLRFLTSEGLLLSASQSILVAETERSRADGYRRLAGLVRHEENGFVQTLEALMAKLWNADDHTLIASGIDRDSLGFLKTTMESKKELSMELSGEDPLTQVPAAVFYKASSVVARGSTLRSEMAGVVRFVKHALGASVLQLAEPVIDVDLAGDVRSPINPYIIERILRNAAKNSIEAAVSGAKASVTVQLSVSIRVIDTSSFLEIVIDDDAGGITDPTMPRRITPHVWMRYRSDRVGLSTPDRGNGFWLIARYAHSSGGAFVLEDLTDASGHLTGVRYRVTLGLKRPDEIS